MGGDGHSHGEQLAIAGAASKTDGEYTDVIGKRHSFTIYQVVLHCELSKLFF